jgi:hypothetical protein
MRGKEGSWSTLGIAVEVFDDRPRDRQAIVGGRAAADFIEDDQRPVGRVVQDVGRLVGGDLERRMIPSSAVVNQSFAAPQFGRLQLDGAMRATIWRLDKQPM